MPSQGGRPLFGGRDKGQEAGQGQAGSAERGRRNAELQAPKEGLSIGPACSRPREAARRASSVSATVAERLCVFVCVSSSR